MARRLLEMEAPASTVVVVRAPEAGREREALSLAPVGPEREARQIPAGRPLREAAGQELAVLREREDHPERGARGDMTVVRLARRTVSMAVGCYPPT